MTAVVQKVASGAADTLAIFRVSNLVRSIKMLHQKGFWVIGTSDKADNSIYQTDLTGPLAIVMGGEGKG
jgi:23S rRNA (guanosine2251-2'-O)-methyltransferase